MWSNDSVSNVSVFWESPVIVHMSTGRWRLGLALSFVTAFFWGLAPIALKRLLDSMDVYTITWYRFLFAGVVLLIPVVRRYELFSALKLQGTRRLLLFVTILSLCSNHILYLLGLGYISPSTVQIVFQLAPIFMLLGSLVFFNERLVRLQWIGFAVLVVGLLLFFNRRLNELMFGFTDLTGGVILILAAVLTWTMYALAQKQLLKSLPSATITLLIYLAAVVVFLPFARPAQLFNLNRTAALLLAFCALSTLISWCSFAEALNHLEASRVSMILALIPLITVAAMAFGGSLLPDVIQHEPLNFLSIVGTILVVLGSMVVALRQSA